MNLRTGFLTALFVTLCTLSSSPRAEEDEESIEAPPVNIRAERAELIAAAPMRVEMAISVEARGFTVGEGRDVFEHDGEDYRVVSEARTAGVVRAFKRVEERRESRGKVTADGIRPEYFRQERSGKAPKTAQFDWPGRRLELSEGKETETVDLPERTLDQTSLPYAFVFAEPPTKGSFEVHVTDGRRLTDYEVAFVGRENSAPASANSDTLHYRKVQRGNDKRGFEFWLSLAHHRLPVRIRIVEKDGTAFDSNVTQLQFTRR